MTPALAQRLFEDADGCGFMKPWSDEEIATVNSPSSSKCVFEGRERALRVRDQADREAVGVSARSTSGTSSYSVKWWHADQAS